jgi:hypothetical protein
MYPHAFCTELSDSLTAFYEKILKKVGAGGSPVGKALPREAEKIPVPAPVPSTEDAEEGHGERKPRRTGQRLPVALRHRRRPPPKAAPAAKGGKSQKEGGGSA